MGFGIIPSHSEQLSKENLSNEKIIVISKEIFETLNWDFILIDNNNLIASRKFSFPSFGERMEIKINENDFEVTSESKGIQFFDSGLNKQNVFKFIKLFNELENKYNDDEIVLQYQELILQ